ncbi:FAD dependent oxidoreductase-domain-containing protein [Aspergillus flavus]|uniref:FAD dependent oxidoreductase-domain-containing protein n=1 Tax=Aspergillus flavus (strain ATCC 200026 / FGSC A1120 / IAM 13836 / NRRL 3357 / JCM 12722 / SRRC 167) TaxID=332952 RepID=A0A7U2MML8_ASPFN|nr:FAD dependent oxidoreductase-domain-containing protein [Aspergillus flavus]
MAEAFPVNNGMTSFWRTEPHFLDSHRSTEVLPDTSDIVIVGAGYAGVTTAYHCMRLSQSSSADKPSIVILEARQACSGATGRNGGHLKPDVYYQINAAEEVAAFELAHMAAVKSCVEEEKIDCDLDFDKVIDVQLDDNHCAKLKAGYESLLSRGALTVTEADFTPNETAESVSTIPATADFSVYSSPA